MTLEPVCKDVETAQGVPITVTGVAQVNTSTNLCSVSILTIFSLVLYISVILCSIDLIVG